MNWINFLRKYGPIPSNDNMYDETIQRAARRNKTKPILFEHPYEKEVLECFGEGNQTSVILTGTAGDGKTHLCRQVWNKLGGNQEEWDDDNPYIVLERKFVDETKRIHFIRDLSAWAPQQGQDWDNSPEKAKIINLFCQAIHIDSTQDIFIIARNDGQLVEAFRKLGTSAENKKIQVIIEEFLVEDRKSLPNIGLKFFNLSRGSSANLFDRAIEAFLNHDGWQCLNGNFNDNETFGPQCPIRNNYELLGSKLIQKRLRDLFSLCDHNNLHLPIRQILLLLTNAVLGHSEVKDKLMRMKDVPELIHNKITSQASLYNNIFGGNIPSKRRSTITVFNYFSYFQIGYETSNFIDNILIYGEAADNDFLKEAFATLLSEDKFYGASTSYLDAKQHYLEGDHENVDTTDKFLEMLVRQRRGLYFKIPEDKEEQYKLWTLTTFRFAGEYLKIIEDIKNHRKSHKKALHRIVRGLNRIFTGMLVNDDRYLYLSTSGNSSRAKVSRIFLDKIVVEPRKGERVALEYSDTEQKAMLRVCFSSTDYENFELNLMRFEFLSRVAENGILPASFSKACHEDILAFKSRLIRKWNKLWKMDKEVEEDIINIKILDLTDTGKPEEKEIIVTL